MIAEDGISLKRVDGKIVDGVIELRLQMPLTDVIDDANPPTHMSCDFLGDRLAFGILIYPPRVYEKIRELKHVNHSSGRSQKA